MKKNLFFNFKAIIVFFCLYGLGACGGEVKDDAKVKAKVEDEEKEEEEEEVKIEVDAEGAVPGKWTMDFDAAKKVAKEKNLPIMLNFTGSDWCRWCKIMDKNVFSQQDWKEYSKENILLVYVDFPRDKNLVPEKFVERNDSLKEEFAIKGYPTYLLLDVNGESILGRTGAGKEKTPATFISEIFSFSQYTDVNVQKYVKTLNPKDQKTYLEIVKKLSEENIKKMNYLKEVVAIQKKVSDLDEEVDELQASAQEIRATQLGPDELIKYKNLRNDLVNSRTALKVWLKSRPESNEETTKKYKTMNVEIMELKKQLSVY